MRRWTQTLTYADFHLINSTTWGSNPDLPLGRLTTNLSSGLIFQGTAGNINFINNWFSTWPLDNFYLPDQHIPGHIPSGVGGSPGYLRQ